jgi:isoquinoline 1-oxidoreductase beta subunit
VMKPARNLAPTPSRRAFIQGALAGGLVFAFYLPAYGINEPDQPPDDTKNKFAPNAFIRIDHSGKTTLVMPQVEMGQGVYTAIAMMIAEELDADYSKVVLEHAPPDEKHFANPAFGIQATGNSNSIRAWWLPLRKAAAGARARLVSEPTMARPSMIRAAAVSPTRLSSSAPRGSRRRRICISRIPKISSSSVNR